MKHTYDTRKGYWKYVYTSSIGYKRLGCETMVVKRTLAQGLLEPPLACFFMSSFRSRNIEQKEGY